jgi:hypothetical protein
MLSMAFAPDYATSGRFYVYYTDATSCTDQNCDVRVDEFVRSTADRADPSSRRRVFTIRHRDSPMHDGGTIVFGPDGRLYAGIGDGGVEGDAACNAQRSDSQLGKVLRLDPRSAAPPEIVAGGLRNPYRFSFDRVTGDLLLGDVGESMHEEIDFVAAGALHGVNFGWNILEGDSPFSGVCGSAPPAHYVAPAITYGHPAYASSAVTGGVVVRDLSVPALLGRYVYADFYAGEVRSAVVDAGGATGDGPTGLSVAQLSSFGQDSGCRVYVTSLAGPVYRLKADAPGAATGCATAAGPPAGALPPDRVRPVLRHVTVSHRRFRVGVDATPRIARAGAGTAIAFTLSEDAAVTLRLYRVSGHRRAAAGTLVRRRVQAGRRHIHFTGRVGTVPLAAGTYVSVLRARDPAGNVSAKHRLRLTVLGP